MSINVKDSGKQFHSKRLCKSHFNGMLSHTVDSIASTCTNMQQTLFHNLKIVEVLHQERVVYI